jgi:hypothetical protein
VCGRWIRDSAGRDETGQRGNSGQPQRGSGLRSLKEPVDDGSPVMRLRIVERVVVGARGKNEQFGAFAAAGDEVVSHLRGEEAITVSLDDEDGDCAVAERFFC